MWLNICEATANLILSILLARRLGPVGVALGTLFPLLVTQMLIMPVYSSREFKISLWNLLRKGLVIPIIVGLLMACINITCMYITPPVTWLLFVIDVVVSLVLGASVCFGMGLSKQERGKLISKLI